MTTKSVVIGFLSGATVGAAAALLFAPQKGKHLRAEIARKAVMTADELNDYVRTTAARAGEALRAVAKKTPKAA